MTLDPVPTHRDLTSDPWRRHSGQPLRGRRRLGGAESAILEVVLVLVSSLKPPSSRLGQVVVPGRLWSGQGRGVSWERQAELGPTDSFYRTQRDLEDS